MDRLISVLLVDDNISWRLTATGWLQESGMVVVDAGTGKEALEKALIHKPDISILDMNMPDMTGLDVLRLLRAEGLYLPCILVSADASKEIRMKALEEGVYTFLQKPVPPDLLKFTVDRALKGRLGDFPGENE